jgi:hypothetical protein
MGLRANLLTKKMVGLTGLNQASYRRQGAIIAGTMKAPAS